jgi:hypothetical protein
LYENLRWSGVVSTSVGSNKEEVLASLVSLKMKMVLEIKLLENLFINSRI